MCNQAWLCTFTIALVRKHIPFVYPIINIYQLIPVSCEMLYTNDNPQKSQVNHQQFGKKSSSKLNDVYLHKSFAKNSELYIISPYQRPTRIRNTHAWEFIRTSRKRDFHQQADISLGLGWQAWSPAGTGWTKTEPFTPNPPTLTPPF